MAPCGAPVFMSNLGAQRICELDGQRIFFVRPKCSYLEVCVILGR